MRLPDSRVSARHLGLSAMLIYSLTALTLAVLFLWAGTRKARNRRTGLPPPDDRCRRFDFKIEPPSRYVP